MVGEKDTVNVNGLKYLLSYEKEQEDRDDDFSKCGVELIRYLTIDFSLLGDMQSEKISAWDK